jgi:hypothetical protein
MQKDDNQRSKEAIKASMQQPQVRNFFAEQNQVNTLMLPPRERDSQGAGQVFNTVTPSEMGSVMNRRRTEITPAENHESEN